MPRDIPVGNGTLLVTFDQHYRIRDLYFPHVGRENHVGGHPCRLGVWCEGRFCWIDDPSWSLSLGYVDETLITRVTATHASWGLQLDCQDAVDFHENVYLKRIRVRNLAAREREVRLFLHHDFNLYGSDVGDTVLYDPLLQGLVHYKARRYLLVNVSVGGQAGVRHFATGIKRVNGAEGTWRDAEDGWLEGNPIAQGSVDATLGIFLNVPALGEQECFLWIAAGKTHRDVRLLNQLVVEKTPQRLLHRTACYWRLWVNTVERDFEGLPRELVALYKRSLLILRTQIDNDGAIVAATDSDVLQFNRDTYSYVWPRDGALAAYALDQAGYMELSKRFFFFCKETIREEGYFLHKYHPDGSLASSWHPWIQDGVPQLPIQEDGTALVVWALWHHYQRFRNIEFIKPMYRPVIIKAADFMASYRDRQTGLPLPSYDLWEERQGIFTFTCAAVYGGLQAASRFAACFGEEERARTYRIACQEIRAGMDRYLYQEKAGRFARMVRLQDGKLQADTTVDASLYGLFAFGAYPTTDERVVRTMEAVREHLWVKTEVGGIARYQGDTYYRDPALPPEIPGNPWFICTLWWTQYLIARAASLPELRKALKPLSWVCRRALPSGVLAEQIHPLTNQPLSVSPLTWSHATVVTTIHAYLEKAKQLQRSRAEETRDQGTREAANR